MDSQTVRTALGTLQANPDADAWGALSESLMSPDGDLGLDQALELLDAARAKHAERGEWTAVARLLELSVQLTRDLPREKEYLRLRAEVASAELFDDVAADQALNRLLEIDPEDTEALSRLAETADKRDNWSELAKSYAAEAETASDDVYQSAMLMRSAEVEVRYAASPRLEVAAETLERAVRLDPTNAAAAKLLEVVYRRQDKWEEAARVLERVADRSPEPAVRIAAGVRLARIYLHRLSDEERAARAYDRVLIDDPGQADALDYVTTFFSQNERWDALVRVYERPLEASNTAAEDKLGEMLQIAMLHWRKRQSLPDAEVWFERIRKIDPANDGMLAFYREYKKSLDDDAGLAQILVGAQRALPEGDPRRTEIAQEVAQLAESQANAQKAVEQYKSILRQDPDNAEAREALKRLYKQTQGHNALVELLRQQLERTPEANYEERLAILREIAGVYREYVKSDTALVSVLNQIVQLDGQLDEHDIGEVRELVSLYQKLGRWRDLLSSQQLLAELVSDVEEKKRLFREVARRWLDQFSNVQHAMDAYAALHALDPSDEEATERLEELYRKRRAWKELFALYEEQLQSRSGLERVPVLKEMAQLAAERLNRGADAVAYYREILDLDPTRMDVLDRLERHAERSKDWATLADVLERRLGVLEDLDSKLIVLQKLGAVYADHMGEAEKAVGAWQRVLQLEPRQPRAMRVLRDTFLRSEDFDALEQLYASQGDYEGLVEVLSNAADRAADPATKIALSYRAARVYEEELAQPDRAFRSYERILANDPTDTRAAGKLLPLYEADEKWARMPALYEVMLQGASDPAEKVAWLGKLVEVTGQRLMDRRAAALHARRAYEISPTDERALELLEQTSRASGHWDELVTALEARLAELDSLPASEVVSQVGAEEAAQSSEELEQAAGGGPSGRGRKRRGRKKKAATVVESSPVPVARSNDGLGEEQRNLCLRLATVYAEELNRVDDAVAKLRGVLERRPTDGGAASLLESILRKGDRRDGLRWLNELRVEHAPTDEERVAILNEWAELEESFGELLNARQLYARALELAPDDAKALAASVRLALAADDFEAAANGLAKQRELSEGLERAAHDLDLAELYAHRLERATEALEVAREALELGGDRARAIAVLQALVERPEVKADAARLLAAQFEASGDARQQARALVVLIGETTDPGEQIDLYHRLTSVFEEQLGEYGAALGAVLEALTRHPGELGLWDRGDRLAVVAGRPIELAERYREALRLAAAQELGEDIQRELATRAARLHDEVLSDALGAVPYLEQILAIDPDDERAFGRLKEILTGAERWGELEALYEQATARVEDPIRKADLFAEVALIAEEIIDDPAKAAEYHERILALDPLQAGSLEALDRLYSRLGHKERLAQVVERRLELASGDALSELRVRAARLALELHDPEKAVGHVESLLLDNPNDPEARAVAELLLEVGNVKGRAARALETVYELRDEVRDLVRVLCVRIDALRPSEDEVLDDDERQAREDERRDLLRRVATLRNERLHDDEGSFEVFAELAPLDPLDAELRERLVESGRRLGRHARIAEVLTQTAVAADGVQLKGEILMQVAGIQQEYLGDIAAAEQTYREVLSLDAEEADLVLPAARALESIFVGQNRPRELAEVLRLQVKLEADSERRGALLARVGELSAEVLGDVDGAITAWQARLEELPDDAEALAALDELYTRAERWEDLVGVLERRRDLVSGEGERRNLMVRLAEVQRDRLGQASAAVDSFQAVVDEFGPDASIYEALERLFVGLERWDELNDVYERHLDVATSDEERLSVLAALGDSRRLHSQDYPGALDAYRRALSIDASHAPSRAALEEMLNLEDRSARTEAAEILHPIYEAEGDHARLIQIVEIEVELADDPSERLEKLELATRIAEDALSDAARAFGYAERAVREAAGLGEVASRLATLDRLAGQTGRRKEQAAVLEAIAPEIFDGDLQVEVTRRVAELQRFELGSPERAREMYSKVLELRSDDVPSLLALEELYAEAGDAARLLEVLERRAELAEGDEERRNLAYRQAELLAGELGEPARAIEVYEGIISLSLDRRAVDALSALYSKAERWDDLTALLLRRVDERDGSEPDLRVQVARIARDHGQDVERALDELERALECDNQHDGAIALLEELQSGAEEGSQRARAAALLEPVYLVRADFDRVTATLRTRLQTTDDPEERRELIGRLAQIQEEQKEDYAGALEISAQLLDDDLGDESVIAELERLAKVAGAERRLAEIYAERVAKVDVDDDASTRLARRAADLFVQAGADDEALPLFRRALAFAPEDESLFEAVDAILIRSEAHRERVDLYTAALDHRYEPDARVALLHTIAELQQNRLGDLDAAIEAHRAVLDADEGDARSLDALTALYTTKERWNDLAELYQARAERASAAEGAEYRLALARLFEQHLESPERAVEQLEEIVRDLPDHAEAVRYLESFREHEQLKERVVEVLRPLYESADDWKRLIKLNEDRFSLAADAAEQVAVLRETAELWESRGQELGKARRVLAEAVRIEPDDAEVRAEFERLVEATSSWQELAELYEQLLADYPDLLSKRDVLAKLAEVQDRYLDDPRKALAAYAALHEIEQGELEPVAKMEQLALLLSDWQLLEKALVAKADLVFDEEERAEAWRRIGELRRHMLEDADGALQAYEQAFDIDQTHALTLDFLIELYEERGDASRLVDLYRQRFDLAGEDELDLKFELMLASARRFEKDLSDRSRAIESLVEALVLKPDSRETRSELNRLYRAEEMWSDLLDSLRLEASAELDPERRLELRKEAARLLASKLESHEEAIEAYRLVLDERATDEESLDAVRRLGEEHEHLRSLAAEVLVPVLRQAGLQERLVDVLEMRLTVETDPLTRAEILRTIAQVQETELGNPRHAAATLLRAVGEQPEALDIHTEIERLATQTGDFAAYVQTLEEKGGEAYDPDIAKDLLVRAGRLAEEKLGDAKRAIRAYVRATEQAGDQPDLLSALDRLYTSTGEVEELQGVLERRLGLADGDEEQAELYYRLGRLQLDELKRPAEALGSLRLALERDRSHQGATSTLELLLEDPECFEEVFEVLEGVYRERAQTDRLAGLFERRVAKAQSAIERLDMRRELARVLEDDCQDPAAAQRVLQQALVDDPADGSVLDELERLAPITGDWAGAATALLSAVGSATGLDAQSGRELCMRAAGWLRDKVGDAAAAEGALVRAAEFAPDDDDVLAELEALQSAPGRERDLIETLKRRARLALDDDARLEMYRRAKELCDRLGDAALGEELLRQVLELDEVNLWALAGLTEARRAAGDEEETFRLLVRRAELELATDTVRQLRFEAAEIALRRGDLDQATPLFEQLFEDEPTDQRASRALQSVYEQAEKWEDLARLNERLIDLEDGIEQRNALRVELARLVVKRLGDRSTAIDLLQAVLDELPSQADAVVALSELYEEAGRHDDLADLLDAQISAARSRGDQEAELRFLVRLGGLYDRTLNDPERAVERYREVLDRDPNQAEALEALVRLHTARGERAEAAEVLERLVANLTGSEAAQRGVELAELYEALGDGERATTALETALRNDPANGEVRERLRARYEKSGVWDKLADLLVEDADAEGDARAKIALLRKAADLHRAKRQDMAAAADLLARASELDPEDRDLLLELCDAYSESGRGAQAVEVLHRIVESFGGKRSKELAEIHRRLATAYVSQGNKEQALEELNKAFRIEPGNVFVLKQLGDLAYEIEDFKKAQQMYLALRLQKLDGDVPISKAQVLCRLGQIHQKLGEDAKAKQMFERALQADENLEEAKQGLAELG